MCTASKKHDVSKGGGLSKAELAVFSSSRLDKQLGNENDLLDENKKGPGPQEWSFSR